MPGGGGGNGTGFSSSGPCTQPLSANASPAISSVRPTAHPPAFFPVVRFMPSQATVVKPRCVARLKEIPPWEKYHSNLLERAQMASPLDPAPVLDLLCGFRQSAVLFAAVHLGVFDRLEQGPADAATLAGELSCQADALQRLLDALAGLQLLTAGPRYALTPTAQTYLTRSSPRRMTGYIHYSLRALWPMWGHLADAVREGSNRWKQVFGLDGPLFANFFRTEEDRREFLLGMHGFGQISSPQLAEAFDFSRFAHLVDLGGATGHLAVAFCRRWPHLRATVSDLPAAVPLAQEMIARETDVAPRITVLANDFFAEPLPPGDLYAVGRILHDWGEEKIHALLGKIAAALPVGGPCSSARNCLMRTALVPRGLCCNPSICSFVPRARNAPSANTSSCCGRMASTPSRSDVPRYR